MVSHSPEEIWTRALEIIKGSINKPTFETWFRPTKAIRFEKNSIVVEIPNKYFNEWVESRYLDLIKKTVSEIIGQPTNIEYVLSPASKDKDQIDIGSSPYQPPIKQSKNVNTQLENRLNERYTFETFVVGKSNQLTHAAAQAVAESPATTYNPLFIYGGVGLGKTHIMQAIGNYLVKRNNKRVVYVSSEQFTNELIYAIQHGETLRFREKYRGIDLLCIDDIQFLAGKEGTQEEFFHTFNTLYDAQKQIVVTSDRPPKEIPTLEDRLVSRFEWGLVTDIQPPDLETRIAILNKKAERDAIHIPPEVTHFIANNITTNIRELEGALIRLLALSSLTNREINMILVQEVLGDIANNRPRKINMDMIIEKVIEHFGVSPDELTSKKRTNAIAFPRQVAMYLSRQLTDCSLAEIGHKFGGRDHTTVMHGIDKVADKIKIDHDFRELILNLSNYITG